MLYLDEDHLNRTLATRGMTLSQLARTCGISRQSIYAMFKERSVFNSSFVKILTQLGVDHGQLTTSREYTILRAMPPRLQKAVTRLVEFCCDHHANLVLFGSRARGKASTHADWDFGVYAQKALDARALALTRQGLLEEVFPNRIDVVNLNVAPDWFLESIAGDIIQVHGRMTLAQFMERRAA